MTHEQIIRQHGLDEVGKPSADSEMPINWTSRIVVFCVMAVPFLIVMKGM